MITSTLKNTWGLVVLGAIIVGLSYYSWISGLLAWIGFIPFLHSFSIKNQGSSFLKGYLFGLIQNLIAFYWIGLNSGTSFYIALLSLFAAICYLSIFWGTFSVLLSKIKTKNSRLLVFPFLVIILEWLRSVGPLGFPWSNLALTQIEFLPLMQIVSYTGSYGVSGLIAFINVILYYTLTNITKNKIYLLSIFTLSFLFIWFWGIRKIEFYNNYFKTFNVAIIQPNIDPNSKWEIENKQEIIFYLDSLYNEAITLGVDLILFPETAYPTYLRLDKKIRNRIQNKVNRTQIPCLIGTVDRAVSIDGEKKYFNSSILFSPNKDIEIYEKVHLVPFAEYVPLSDKLSFLKKINFGQGNFSHGEKISVFNLNGLNIATLICYESSMPSLVTKFVKKGADILTIQTNDGWLGMSDGPYQHYNIAKIRAIENRIPIIRSGNTGISGMILPNGISIIEKPLNSNYVFKVSVPLIDSGSFYSQYGNIFVLLSFITLIIFLVCIQKKYL